MQVLDNTVFPPNVILLRFKSSMKGKESLLPRNKTKPLSTVTKTQGVHIYI